MSKDPESALPPGVWRGAVIVGVVAGVALLPWLGARDLWAPDEPRFAVVGAAMLESGDWIVPRMNGEPVPLLPPLTYWLVAAFSAFAGGVGELSARLGVAACAAATLVATYLLGAGIGRSRVAGFASAAVVGTTAQLVHQARFLQADMPLTAGTTWALALFWLGYVQPERRRLLYPLMGAAIAWAILAKGPVGFVVPGLVVLVFLLGRRELLDALLRRGSFWAAVGLAALLVVPWYAAASLRGGDAFARELLLTHNFGMFFSTWSHARPWWYYLVRLPEFFLPWTLLLPAAGAWVVARAGADDARRRDRWFLLAWAGTLFLFFSISDAKQSKYLLPLYPALAIGVGLLWTELDEARARLRHARWLVSAPIVAIGVLLAILGLGLVGGGGASLAGSLDGLRPPAPEIVRSLAGVAIGLGVALLASGVATLVLLGRGRADRALAVPAAAVAVGAIVLAGAVAPAIDPWKSARTVCDRLAEHAPPDAPLAIVGIGWVQHGDYIHYGGRPVVTWRDAWGEGDEVAGVLAYLARDERVFVLSRVGTFEQLHALPDRPPMVELFRARKGSKTLVVFSNRP